VYEKRRQKRNLKKGTDHDDKPIENEPGEAEPCLSDAAPTSNSFAPMPAEDEQGFWWDQYEPKDIVALDCEMVSLNKLNQFNKHIEEAAKVAIVNWKGDKHEVGIDNFGWFG